MRLLSRSLGIGSGFCGDWLALFFRRSMAVLQVDRRRRRRDGRADGVEDVRGRAEEQVEGVAVTRSHGSHEAGGGSGGAGAVKEGRGGREALLARGEALAADDGLLCHSAGGDTERVALVGHGGETVATRALEVQMAGGGRDGEKGIKEE